MADNGSMRDRILDAALELLREGGLKRFGQTQIAKAAGIPQGHLTYYFPRKADLVLAVARRSVDLVVKALELVPGGLGKGKEARAQVMPFIEALMRDRARTRILLGLVVEADENPDVRALMVENANATRELLARGLGLDAKSDEAALALSLLWGLGIYEFLYREQATPDVGQLLARFHEWLDRVLPPES